MLACAISRCVAYKSRKVAESIQLNVTQGGCAESSKSIVMSVGRNHEENISPQPGTDMNSIVVFQRAVKL